MKKKALQEIKLCEAQLIQLLEELKGLTGVIKSTEKRWGMVSERARVKDRIHTVRKDLLQLKKTIYEWEVWR